jgi:hypothetical protein
MSMLEDAPVVARRFETCTDPHCGEVLCKHYRVGLAAGHEFMKGTKTALARVRVGAGESGGKPLSP